MLKDSLLTVIASDLTGDARFGADVGIAMRMIRADVMSGNSELPPWLTAHLDTCGQCGSEKVWMHKPFNSDTWLPGQAFSGMGWHGCKNCSQIP